MNMKKAVLGTAVAVALGTAAIPQIASAAVLNFDWDGNFTMLTPTGNAILNTSLTARGANQAMTPVTGTMAFDTVTGAGTATLVPFAFFDSADSLPAEAVGIDMQSIGDGFGGPGTLILGNMLFNWNGNNGIPVSIVLDAAGFFGNVGSLFTSSGAPIIGGTLTGSTAAGSVTPAVDGTYVIGTGLVNVGPALMATTDWNVHIAPACGDAQNSTTPAGGGCMGVNPSGGLPLVADTALNTNKTYTGPNVYGIGGVPMWDGPFANNNANFDITNVTLMGVDPAGSIGPHDVGPYPSNPVPVPAAVWLFGSGLMGLVGVARRRKAAV